LCGARFFIVEQRCRHDTLASLKNTSSSTTTTTTTKANKKQAYLGASFDPGTTPVVVASLDRQQRLVELQRKAARIGGARMQRLTGGCVRRHFDAIPLILCVRSM
jgi:hypothetical protein